MKEKPIAKDLVDKYLNNSYKVFSSRNLTKTAEELEKIIIRLNSKKPDYALIEGNFKILQATMIVEYQGTDMHKTQCATFLKKRWLRALKENHSGVQKIVNNVTFVSNRQNRTKARYTLGKMLYILQRGSKTEEDHLISLSLLYMYIIDGIFGKDLRDYYIWDKLSKQEPIEVTKLLRMKINDLVGYFKTNGGEFLVNSWNDDVRNSIAHASFHYDKIKNKMVYEERRKNVVCELSLKELGNMYEKLDHVDELLMYMDQVMNINDCIDNFRRLAK